MEVRVVDRHETYELQIRRGVLQVRPGAAPDASIRLEATDAVLRQLLTSRAGWHEAVANGTVKVSRGETGLDGFLGLFD
jgi:alkyl sulfatase BDS1-like metallo-beta-lactamase superfamily hydrolase